MSEPDLSFSQAGGEPNHVDPEPAGPAGRPTNGDTCPDSAPSPTEPRLGAQPPRNGNGEADDLFAPDDPFEPGQHAMHGLLAAIFGDSTVDREWRARAILDRIRNEAGETRSPTWVTPPPSRRAAFFRHWSPLTHPRRWLLTEMAAAGILVLLSLSWQSTPQARADLYADAANAGTAWFRLAGSVNFILDPNSPEGRTQQAKLAALEREVREGLRQAAQKPNADFEFNSFCQAWQAYYCLLRDLGRRDAAIREAQAAIAYSRSRRDNGYLHVFLDGLGNIHAAFGEYTAARTAYLDSLEFRRRAFAQSLPEDPHHGEPGYEGDTAQTLVPLYLRLANLALAEHNVAEARDWLGKADLAMSQWMRTICEINKAAAPKDADLWNLWLAMPREFRHPKLAYSEEEINAWPRPYSPSAGLSAWLGATLYHQAILLRVEEDYANAQKALDRAMTIPDFYPSCGEFPLPYLEKLEAARLAIIRKDYPAALAAVEHARAYILDPFIRPTSSTPEVNKLPLRPVEAAELDILEGVALLGLEEAGSVAPPSPTTATAPTIGPSAPMTPRRAEALRLIARALAVPEKLAANLPADQRENFLSQFAAWAKLAGQQIEEAGKE